MNRVVYILRRPDKVDLKDSTRNCPFYVGMGDPSRPYTHISEALNSDYNSHKCNVIRYLYDNDMEVEIEYLKKGISREEALNLEIELISYYGREDQGHGPLTNKTDGGEGNSDGFILSNGKNIASLMYEDGTHPFANYDTHLSVIGVRNGTHHFLGENNPAKVMSREGTHFWLGDGNPIHKQSEEGRHPRKVASETGNLNWIRNPESHPHYKHPTREKLRSFLVEMDFESKVHINNEQAQEIGYAHYNSLKAGVFRLLERDKDLRETIYVEKGKRGEGNSIVKSRNLPSDVNNNYRNLINTG